VNHTIYQEFSSLFFIAVYLPPQTDDGTKTALNELYKAISKQENAHPEALLQAAGDFNVGKSTFYLLLPARHM
jgi:polynucleotide 5'-kinase involved in rRNA processing